MNLWGPQQVVVGEDVTFQGPTEHLRSQGVEVTIVDNQECKDLMSDFIAAKPELWNEDIAV
jgi:cytosine/creatinine deaminase